MTPVEGPATLPRCLDQILAIARRARGSLPPFGTSIHTNGDRLFAYWENTLDADARREVVEHARSCPECGRWLGEIGRMFGAMASGGC